MKKIITLILALAAFAIGTQKAYAEPTETLDVTMKSGNLLKDHPEAAFALEFLEMVNQIKYTQEENITYVYSMSDKHLMTINTDNSYITLAPNVTDADDIFYTITDADREMLRETDMDIYDVLKDYRTIQMHFVATELRDLVVTLKTGKNIYPNTEDLYAIYSLIIFGQIAQDSESFSFLSLDNKLLFTFTPFEEGENMHYVVNLAHSISSADDIVYTITDQDRETLEELDDPTYKTLLADCKTVQLHFDTSAGEDEEADWVANIETGASFTDQNTFLPIYFMSNIFHQIKMSVDEDTGWAVYSSLNDKVLFYYDENDGSIIVAPGVGPTDDIMYTITDEDRMQLLNNQELYPYIAGVKTIQLHFIANDQQEEDWVAWLKTGDNMGTNTKAQTAVFCLFILNQVQYVEEGDDEVVYSLTDKKLVIIEGSTGNVTLAPGVSSADDIIYTLTPDDLEVLNSANKSIYNKVMNCKTIQLHFDTSGGGHTPSLPEIHGELGTQGIWYFEDGVLTVDYIGQMPWDCTRQTTDPEVAYRLKWIDLLPQIKEIVITGKDVEIQPYFLYYEGDGDLGQHPDDHVKKLTLGSGVKKVGKQALTLYDLKDVYCYGIEPPELSSDTGGSNCFWKSRIQANVAFLHLVPGASTNYFRTDREWINFNLWAHALDPADDPVGVKSLTPDPSPVGEGSIYDLSGRKLDKPQKGINIIRYSDGTSKKILVK